MLQDASINPERVTIEWVSGAEGPKFAQTVTAFTNKIKALGPNVRPGGFKTRSKDLKEAIPCR